MVIVMSTACTFGGEKGLSAYEIAVKNGFSGTEAEWLASLKGSDGKSGADGKSLTIDDLKQLYNEEKAKGYEGDFYTFLKNKMGFEFSTTRDNAQTISDNMLSCVTINTVMTSSGILSSSSSISAGSGVIYSIDRAKGNATIITNYHVVYDQNSPTKIGKEIRVMLRGQEYEDYQMVAKYVGGSMKYDLAVLQIENSEVIKKSNATAVTLDTSPTKVGGTAIAIGNPQGTGMSVTEGIVSVDSEYIEMNLVDNSGKENMRVLRVDTAINQGNSGGGLFNAEGKLIGIVNAKIIKTGVESVGYAIPASVVKGVVENILANCDGVTNTSVLKPTLGVTVEPKDSQLEYVAESGIYKIKETVRIKSVANNSLASGKFQEGDILQSVTINGVTKEIDRVHVVTDSLLDARAGESVTIKVLRDGKSVDVTVPITTADMQAVK